jgi:hypothetical protein
VKKMMFLLAACAGGAGTFLWLRGGGDLGQMKNKAKHAMGRAEDELDERLDDRSQTDGSAPGYVPHTASA